MKIAICGTWHVHTYDYTKKALDFGAEIVGVYEENTQWKNDFAKNNNIKAFDTFEDLLNSEADSVIVCTSTDTHPEYIIAIANAKKNIFTEKVLALTVEDCEKIKKAVEDNGVTFTISFVQKYTAGTRTLKKIVDSGELGKINYMRFRNCHSGSIGDWLPNHFYNEKQCGGGAMIDLGAHGMYIINSFLGLPLKYTSVFTNWSNNHKNTDGVEDSAVTVMSYTDGTIAVNETGFVNGVGQFSIEVVGDKGYARFTPQTGVKKQTTATENKLVDVDLEPASPSPLEQFLTGNLEDGCGINESVDLTKMMVGAYENIL